MDSTRIRGYVRRETRQYMHSKLCADHSALEQSWRRADVRGISKPSLLCASLLLRRVWLSAQAGTSDEDS